MSTLRIVVLILSIFFTTQLFANNVNYNILSFSGAGSFGAVEIGILTKLSDTNSIVNEFDLYTGISAGGLNAGILSHFTFIREGLPYVKKIIIELNNHDIYRLVPKSNISLFNTFPLEYTLTKIIKSLNQSNIQTLIGTTNLNTGFLDTYYYNTQTFEDKIKLLMSTSAIPIVFPPIQWNGNLYVDGGELTNQLLAPITSNNFINVTYITASEGLETTYNISTFEEIIKQNLKVVLATFDNSITKLNVNCGKNKPRGIIYMYFVNSSILTEYSSMNFNKGDELFNIGYNNVECKIFNLC